MKEPQQPGDQQTKRYAAANLAAITSGLDAGEAQREVNPSPRDYSDPEKLQQLHTFGIALQQWAVRFNSHAVAVIASGSMNFLSLQRLLQYVKEQVATLAPEAAVPDSASHHAQRAAVHLDDAVFMAMQLPEFIEGNLNFRWEPAGLFPDGHVPAEALLDAEWMPPDNPPAPLVRDAMKEPVKLSVSRNSWWTSFEQRTDRVGKLASNAIQALVAHINSDDEGGFSRGRVDEYVRSLPDEALERRVHDAFMQTIDALAILAGRKDAGLWTDWQNLIREPHGGYGEWIDKCFAPTVPLVAGRNRHAVRSTRQSKKDALRRLVARVSQYGTLLRGAVDSPRVSMAIEGLSILGLRLVLQVRKLYEGVTPPSPSDLRRQVWLLDQQAVAASSLEQWKDCLGPRAEACGRLAEIIACGDAPQAKPWEPKEHTKTLKDARLFNKSDPDKEFTEIRLRMQEAGIALQAPWQFIEGTRAEPETKKGVADKWLLNPMAQILAPAPD